MFHLIATNLPEFWVMLKVHLQLTGLSVVLGILVAVPLAILASRIAALKGLVMALGNLGQTIPSLVILGLSIPLVGIGFAPALLALFLRAVLPILLNTYVGITGVDSEIIEAARGMGMTENQILWRVQIPVAVPVIVAGVRTATIQAVSLATLGSFVGAGTLGDWIQQGIMMMDTDKLLAGAIPTATLALVLDVTLGRIERIVTPKGLRV